MVDSPNSALRGSTEARLWTPPARDLNRQTTRGFEAIEFAEGILGIALHPWQKWLLIHALELREDGSFRFRTVLVCVARQNGKTTVVQVLALWRMFVDSAPLVIGTAQNLDLAEEAWQGAVDIAEGTPELAAEIQHVDRTNGKKQIRLVTGERYKVAAASRRGGRGLSGDLVVLDELREHQNWQAWGAVTKTTMAREMAQVWGLSNAGDRESVVLDSLRRRAVDVLDGAVRVIDDGSLGLFEWSAPDDCELHDPAGWSAANPSLGHPHGVTETAIRSALSTDPEPVFRTEVLCQWVESVDAPVLDLALWYGLGIGVQEMYGPVLAVEVALDRSRATIAGAWWNEGRVHVEVIDEHGGVAWVGPRVVELARRYDSPKVVLDGGTEAAALADPLTAEGVEVELLSQPRRIAACGAFHDAAVGGRLSHNGDPAFADALANARWKDVGDGARVFSRRKSTGDIAPLYAAVLAHWGLVGAPADEEYDLLASVG